MSIIDNVLTGKNAKRPEPIEKPLSNNTEPVLETELEGKIKVEREFEAFIKERPHDVRRVLRMLFEKKREENRNNYIFELCKKTGQIDELPSLSDTELEEIRRTWGSLYDEGVVNPQWAAFYKGVTGEFHPDIVCNDIHNFIVERSLIEGAYIRGLCDKNIMPLVTPTIRHPHTIIRKLSGCYLDENFNHIDEETAVNILYDSRHIGAVVKLCRSSGGKGVSFVSEETEPDDIRKMLQQSPYITVQHVLKQHPEMAKMNPTSLNTVRLMTILVDDDVHIVSAVARIGAAGSKVDNFHSGGLSCGIKKDGTLNEFACYVNGDRVRVHDNGFVFAEGRVPNYQHICEEVTKLQYCLPMFGVVSWDIAVDEDAEPVLIEYNVGGGGVTVHQFSNGPLYGDSREDIIKHVFKDYVRTEDKYETLDFSYIIQPEGAIVTKTSCEAEQICIPATIDELPVVSIAKRAFSGDNPLKTLVIDANLKKIDYLAFYKNIGLQEVLFRGCSEEIDRSAFNECETLQKVVLGDGTKVIRKRAFAYCPELSYVEIPNSVERISYNAFYDSPKVTIYCKKDSYAWRYAEKYGINCVEK